MRRLPVVGARARLGEAGVFAVLVDNVVHALCLHLCLSTLPPFPLLERAQYRVARWGDVRSGWGGWAEIFVHHLQVTSQRS